MTHECFIDTNVLLHFSRLDEIDWLKLTGSDDVTITVCAVVIAELDDKKRYGHTLRLKKRAAECLRWLDEWHQKGDVVRAGVHLRLVAGEPQVDWRALGLDPEVNDDRLIAAALTEGLQHASVHLVSSDFGVKLKAEAAGLPLLILPDEYALQNDPTEEEKEIRELRKKVREMELRAPKPELYLRGDEGPSRHLKLLLPMPEIRSDAEIADLLVARREQLEGMLAHSADFAALTNALFAPAPEEITRFRNQIQPHLVAYKEFLESKRSWQLSRALVFELQFLLQNEGYAPADGLRICLRVPDGVAVMEESDSESEAEEPPMPAKPRSALEMIAPVDLYRVSLPQHLFRPLEIPHLAKGGPKIHKTNSYQIEYERETLLHGSAETLEPIYCRFGSPAEVRPFKIDYTIQARNLVKPSSGQLHVIPTAASR